MLRILGRKGDKADRPAPGDGIQSQSASSKPIDGQLHVLVSRSTVTSTATVFPPPPPSHHSASSRVSTSQGIASSMQPRQTRSADSLNPSARASTGVFSSSRIDEQMHVLTGRAKPSGNRSPIIGTSDLPPRSTSTAPPSLSAPQPRIRASTIPTPPAASVPAPTRSSPPATRAEVNNLLRRVRPAPIPPNAPPAIIAGCISEVLGISDVHGVLGYLEEKEQSKRQSVRIGRVRSDTGSSAGSKKSAHSVDQPAAHADMIPRLAIKAKSLFDDNKRMHSEIRGLHAERADLEAQLKKVQAAMANMVRVAEIMNVRSRFTPPSSPHSDISDAPTAHASTCAACGTACPSCSGVAAPIIDRTGMVPTRTRWSMQPTVPKGFPFPEDDEEPNRLRILPPPRRVSRVASADSTPRPSSIHLGDADCGVSLNRFRISDDNVDTDDEAEHLAASDVDECSKELDMAEVCSAIKVDNMLKVDKPIVEITELDLREKAADPVAVAVTQASNHKHAHRTSFMFCDCECDGSMTTTDEDGGGDVIVVKTGKHGQNRMSMSLEPQNSQTMSLKVQMVTATVKRSGGAGETTSSMSASTVSVEADAGHDGPNVDDRDQDVTDVSLRLDSSRSGKRIEPDGYPWW